MSDLASSQGVPVARDILWRLYEAINRHRVFLIAAGVAFYGLLALFPAIAALVSLYGLFADPAAIQQHISTLQGFLPGPALDLVRAEVERIIAQGRGTLGLVFFTTLAISLWSAMAGIKALFDALNIVHGDQETRGFLSYNLQALLFILGTIVFIALALTAVVLVPAMLASVGLGSRTDTVLTLLRWPVLYVTLIALLTVLYRYGPCRSRPSWPSILWASAIAAFIWLLTSMLFSMYVANLASYNATYGSLGAVIAFMTWIWLSAVIVLIGAELDAALQQGRS